MTSPVLRHVELPPGPGTRVTISLPAGNEMLGGEPMGYGQGFTLDFGGDVWQAELRAAKWEHGGATLELEITGRYAEDAVGVSRA